MRTLVVLVLLTSIAVAETPAASESVLADSYQSHGDLQVKRHTEPVFSNKMSYLRTTLKNLGKDDLKIERFPVCKYRKCLPAGDVSLRYWDSLIYVPHELLLKSGDKICLSSETYSSQFENGRGHVPFWRLRCGRNYIFFSLAWSGGWLAEIRREADGLHVEIELPPEETQLTLKAGESIDGPLVFCTVVAADDESSARLEWLKLREEYAVKTYGGPKPWLPFLYNHWYAVREEIDLPFLERQLDEFEQWGFDLFVLDYGWFEKVGDWRPTPAKFNAGELEDFFVRARHKVKTGIWSCPWLRAADDNNFPPEIDEPRFYNGFMKAYSLDLAGMDFTSELVQHMAHLQKTFGIVWWKYDQEFFGKDSRQGKMRKVIALQNAFRAMRLAYPQLYIESCMSGGRMIDAFTDGIAQSHWIRDGSGSGLDHAESNVNEALGAAEFLPPVKIHRWTNRPNEIDPKDDELLKMYCRSAMIGAWGVSGDLSLIAPQQKQVVLREAAIYRSLNELKTSNLYHVLNAGNERAQIHGIVFYNAEQDRAAMLLYRRQRDGPVAEVVPLNLLRPEWRYKITDVDGTDKTRLREGGDLVKSGLPVHFEPQRRTAVYWIERR